jgi:pimeloyl-ACP methyl ester carboxylesterase
MKLGTFVVMVCCALLVVPAASQAAPPDPTPLGQTCVPQGGVRFCQGSVPTRVPTWDGVPLDVNIALPPTKQKHLPLLVLLHGYGGSKQGFAGDMSDFAAKGYAVLSYSARGFGQSCGSAASRAADPTGCAQGWIHLGDTRYEARDTQYLAGMLADQGIANSRRIGVMGGSYGGGQSLELAMLKNRVRLPDGSFIPWRSPAHKYKMQIAAAVPIVPWSDLVYSLMPNGRTLDYTITQAADDYTPAGIAKNSYVSGLYATGNATGFYAPPGVDPTADIQNWFPQIQGGEPYSPTANATLANEIQTYHSGYYVPPAAGGPAPTLIANGTTDDLFPGHENLRWANKFRNAYPKVTISQMLFSFGHPRGQNKQFDLANLLAAYTEFLDKHLKHTSRRPGTTTVIKQTCPNSSSSGSTITAPTWKQLHPGEVRFQDAAAQTIVSSADALGPQLDPIAGTGACGTTTSADQVGTATYRLPAATGGGYTLLGSPTVVADISVSGANPEDSEIAARLFDVDTGGTQTLVAKGAFRPDANGQVVFQLNPNAWSFKPGHVPKLELLGQDSPTLRPSNASFSIGVSNLDLRLPTQEASGGPITPPAAPVYPPGSIPVP